MTKLALDIFDFMEKASAILGTPGYEADIGAHFAGLFKEYTGITFASYVTEKKLAYAKQLLRTTSMTTLQISEKLGYTSLSAFNHLFKKTFSMTPSEYRKKHK